MSNYIEVSITIGISAQFEWLDKFIDAIYREGSIYVHPWDQTQKRDNEVILQKAEAQIYFEQYIGQIQEKLNFSARPPMLTWLIEDIAYDVSIFSEPGYLRWVIYLPPNKKRKDESFYYSDFEYYLLLLLNTMKEFPILEIATDEDCYADDLSWAQKEGNWWGIKIQNFPPKQNFQMLDVIICSKLSSALLEQFVEKATAQGHKLFPVDLERGKAQVIKNQFTDQKDCLLNWNYVYNGMIYYIHITPMSRTFATRLFFRTSNMENLPYVDQFARHVLKLINNHPILQFVSFDSRYNYFFT